jgi:hypothetical protein
MATTTEQGVTLRERVLSAETPEAKLSVLHNAHAGATAWLVSCGPSATRHQLSMLPDGDVVIAVKQAYRLCGGAHFHLLNHVNREDYEYTRPRPIVMAYPEQVRADISLPQQRRKGSVSESRDFDAWLMERTPMRGYGPGIVYEIGMPLVVHLGCTRLRTIGFDCDKGQYMHFYGGKTQPVEEADRIADAMPLWRDWLASRGVEWTKL